MWIKTETISVPAHANQRTEVNINEWFNNNRSFLLGTPVASQLRGTAGGWVQTMAVAATENQDTLGLLRDRLSQILQMAKGDALLSPRQSISNKHKKDIMATVIPVDKFESNSPFAFILRENPKASGIEIHLPPDATPDPAFIGRIAAAGFLQAHSNSGLWYHKQYSPELMAKARGWVKTCQRFGAYEISPSEPVEQTKSRRRGGTKHAASPTPTPAPTPTTAPVGGNKIVDAVAERVQQMLDSLKEELAVKPDTSEMESLRLENARLFNRAQELEAGTSELKSLRSDNERLRQDMERLRQEHERMETTIRQQQESIDMAVSEVARLGEVVDERDRVITSLRQQLAEWGVVEVEPVAPVFKDELKVAPVFEDELEVAPVFEDDEPAIDAPNFEEVTELGEPPLPSNSEPEPEDTNEVEGFDLDSLGEM